MVLDISRPLERSRRTLQEMLQSETAQAGGASRRQQLLSEGIQALFDATDLTALEGQTRIRLLETSLQYFPNQTSQATHLSWKDPRLAHEAIQHQASLPLLEFLMERALREGINDDGVKEDSLLHTAVRYESAKTEIYIPFLLKKGISIDSLNHQRLAPLDLTMELRKDNLFVKLIGLGAGGRANVNLALKFVKTLRENTSAYQAFTQLLKSNQEIAWHITLDHLLPASASSEAVVFEGATLGARYLLPQFKEELFNRKGDLKGQNLTGRHPVTYISTRILGHPHALYLKEYPELPGLEEAVGILTRALFGFGAPYVELFKINERPILVTQGIEGEVLSNVLRTSPQLLQKLDMESISAMILAAMLTNPEDGKPDNYIIQRVPGKEEETYRLIGIDNDHAFVPAVAKEQKTSAFGTETSVQVKTILYGLDQMKNPVHLKVRERFLKTNAGEVLQAWLKELRQRNDQYHLLFSDKEKQKALTKHESYIGIPFPPGAIEQLYQKLVRLQNLLEDKPCLSHLELLCQVEPYLGHRYKKGFEAPATPLERFLKMDAPFYKKHQGGSHVTVTSSGMLLKSMNVPLKESLLETAKKDSAKAIDYRPHAALQELRAIMSRHADDTFVELLRRAGLNPKVLAARHYEKLPPLDRLSALLEDVSFQEVSEANQRAVLEIFKGKPLQHLTLCHMSALTDAYMIQDLAYGNLLSLNLTGATALTDKILSVIAERAPALERLNLSYMSNLKVIAQKSAFQEKPLVFPSLVSLNASYCLHLESLKIQAPVVSVLNLEQCQNLKRLQVEAPSLTSLNVRGNVFLTDGTIDPIQDQAKNLVVLRLEGCKGVTNRQEREQYPWALSTIIRDIVGDGEMKARLNEVIEVGVFKGLKRKVRLPRSDTGMTLPLEVRELNLMYAGIASNQIPILMVFRNLITLNLAGNGLGDGGARTLADNAHKMAALTSLDIGDNRIREDGAQAIVENAHKMPRLSSLNIKKNYLCDDGARAIAENAHKMPHLTSLDIGDNRIREDGARAIAENAHKMPHLSSLHLEKNSIGEGGMRTIAENAHKMPALTSLNIAENGIDQSGVRAIAENAHQMSRLSSLDLKKNSIGEDGMWALGDNAHKMPGLTSLNIAESGLNQGGARALAENAHKMPALTSLGIARNGLCDDGAQAIADNAHRMPRLTSLYIAANRIGEGGARAIAENAHKMPALTSLNIGWNEIDEGGARAIAENADRMPNLTALDIASNWFGEDGARAIAENAHKMPNLTSLDIGSNKFGEGGKQALEGALRRQCPGVEIRY